MLNVVIASTPAATAASRRRGRPGRCCGVIGVLPWISGHQAGEETEPPRSTAGKAVPRPRLIDVCKRVAARLTEWFASLRAMSRAAKRAFRYRFYPSAEQAAELARTFGCVRLVYNMALQARSEAWTLRQERVNAARNLLAAGLAVAACGDGARPQRESSRTGQSSAKQQNPRATKGIPVP
ncbi:helix-turn-helix domain-containing protein [Actinoplanes sp. NPDC049118]|uniref:helix-turn-helix domain-containing protein n=1 Tax=Actinoplanes sp. NPDC049118 TaxID=3155769 RepID=UPI0033C4A416